MDYQEQAKRDIDQILGLILVVAGSFTVSLLIVLMSLSTWSLSLWHGLYLTPMLALKMSKIIVKQWEKRERMR